jgi:hypothetical protein
MISGKISTGLLPDKRPHCHMGPKLFEKYVFDDTGKQSGGCLWNCEFTDMLSAGVLERWFSGSLSRWLGSPEPAFSCWAADPPFGAR